MQPTFLILCSQLEGSTSVLPLRENYLTFFFSFILPISPGQKEDTLPSATTAPVEVRRTTGARQHLLDDTRTHQAGRKRRHGANPTSDSAAAPGAAGGRPHTLRLETEAPARPSPHTTDRTTPGETPFSLFHFSGRLYSHFVLTPGGFLCCAERGTAPTALTRTVELAAAHAATHPFVKGEEIHPASWKLAGSPGNTVKHRENTSCLQGDVDLYTVGCSDFYILTRDTPKYTVYYSLWFTCFPTDVWFASFGLIDTE